MTSAQDVDPGGSSVDVGKVEKSHGEMIQPKFDADGNRVDLQQGEPQGEPQGQQTGVKPDVQPQVPPKKDVPEQGSEAEYWRGEALKEREENVKLQSVAQYSGIISYLAQDEGAVKILQERMQGITSPAGTPSGDYEQELYGRENTQSQVQPPAQEGNVGQTAGVFDTAEAKAKRKMFSDFFVELANRGMPPMEVDQLTKFIMTPQDFTPQQIYTMYRALMEDKGTPATDPQNQPNNTPHTPAPSGNMEMPPGSVVGISGERHDPRTEKSESQHARDRMVYDPNDLSSLR